MRAAGLVVVSTHAVSGPDGRPRPWGASHLARLGDARTRCGLPSRGWQVLWEWRSTDDAQRCVTCFGPATALAPPALRVVRSSP